MSFREAMPHAPPPTTHQGLCPWTSGPRWETSVPQTPCASHLQILAAPLGGTTAEIEFGEIEIIALKYDIWWQQF